MDSSPRVAIILPTYCEAENIADIIHAIKTLKLNSTILVIDDSSPDETESIVEKLKEQHNNILFMKRPQKMGLGTAITDGFHYLLSLPEPPSYIITMDADFSHAPHDIPRLLGLTEEGSDLVIVDLNGLFVEDEFDCFDGRWELGSRDFFEVFVFVFEDGDA